MSDDIVERARFCVCCKFESTNLALFKRAITEARGNIYGSDDWICRSYWKCVERGEQS